MDQFMNGFILPKWKKYLRSVSKKKRETYIEQKGPFYIWVEFIKDIRKVSL